MSSSRLMLCVLLSFSCGPLPEPSVFAAAGGSGGAGGNGTDSTLEGGGAGSGSGSGIDAGPVSCGGQKFASSRVESNLLIVLDRSQSMNSPGRFGSSVTKWQEAVTAIRDLTSQRETTLRFGLSLFSGASQCDPGINPVEPAFSTASRIAMALPPLADGSDTPIAAGLRLASNSSALADPSRANFVVLVTDGMENCGGDPMYETQRLRSFNIRTFVVGFGDGVDANMLGAMAVAGGTARSGTPSYYQAGNQTELAQAFDAISAGAASCELNLSSLPPDPAKLFVYVNGQLAPRDPARMQGWDYTASDRVKLFGAWCDAVHAQPNTRVELVYGCPDPTVVEGGGGIGSSVDAGMIN